MLVRFVAEVRLKVGEEMKALGPWRPLILTTPRQAETHAEFVGVIGYVRPQDMTVR